MKKEVIVLGVLLITIAMPFANAGFLDKLLGKDVRESPQDVSVTVGNAAPEFISVQGPTTVGLNPGAPKAVSINFTVQDNSGFGDIDDTTLSILFFNDTTEQRTGTSANCPTITNDGVSKKYYNCTINMEHYDAAGNWTITLTINDSATTPIQATNNTESFIVSQSKSITLLPATISFGTVNPGALDTLGLETEVTNNGNFNIPAAGLTITAQHLNGSVTVTEIIPAANFSSADQGVNPCVLGTQLSENVAVAIPAFLLAKGTQATPLPTRNLTHCLKEVPLGLSDQVYSTTFGTIPWELLI